jgi:site-specific DNA-methyltransferase (adenine-specific)
VQRWGAIYSDVESLAWWRIACESAGAEYIRTIPWVRWSMPQTTGDRPPTGWEPVSIFYGTRSGRKHWNGGGNLTHYAHKALRGDDKHPTEKPLDQALDLVQQFSDPGETVLDLFAGSGTTGLACRILGRGFIGTELDPTHAQTAAIRLVQSLSARDAERLARWRRAQDAELAELLAAKHKRSKQEERRIATIQGDWAIGSEHRQAA